MPDQAGALDELLDLAFDAASAGRFDEAEVRCRRALALAPRNYDATLLLGIIAGETGRLDLAEALLREAVAIEPNSAEAQVKLAALLHKAGQADAAVAALQAAIGLAPGMAVAHHDLGVIYLQTGRVRQALACFERSVAAAPDLAIAHQRLGYAHELDGDDRCAIAAYRRAIALDPDLHDALLRLDSLLEAAAPADDILVLLRRAADTAPLAATRCLCRARLLIRERRVEAAASCLGAFLATDPSDGQLHQLRGKCLQQLGRFDEAIAGFEAALAADANLVLATCDIVACRRVTQADRGLIARMAAAFERADLDNRRRTTLAFGLGKALDDLGDYAAAIGYFDAGNRLRHRLCHFDRQGMERFVDVTIAGFSRPFLRQAALHGSPSELPVLIIGMPRSGTTLIEQILSSHPQIGGAGELLFWSGCSARLAPLPPGGFGPAVLQDFAQECLTLLRSLAPGKARVSDKLPENFRFAGLIHAVFPRARIIHCRRDPVDTAVSIYFNQFAPGMDYAYDRSDIVAMYRQYLRLMAHWREVLPPDRFIEVDYERVVADREQTARELIAFCGLDWDEACLRHEDNRRVVRTVSIWQARQPVYKTSVARWRHYEPWLGELSQLKK